MGASGWDIRAPWRGSEAASFVAAQELVLAADDFLWPWHADPAYAESDPASVVRPATLDDLASARELQDFWLGGGTHSILDLVGVATPDAELGGVITPLGEQEVMSVFGTLMPTSEQVEQAIGTGELKGLLGPRWSGRCVAAWADGERQAVYFWGWSGD